MIERQSLARRIVAAFVLLALVVATLFSLTVVISIGYTEDYYAASSMNRELDDLLLPYSFDLSLFAHIRDADVIDHIRRVGVAFYEKTAAASGALPGVCRNSCRAAHMAARVGVFGIRL